MSTTWLSQILASIEIRYQLILSEHVWTCRVSTSHVAIFLSARPFPPLTREQHGLHGHHSRRNHHGRHSHHGHPHSRTLRHKHRSQAHPESNCKTKADLAWRNTGKIETISIATHWCLIILIRNLRARFVGSNVIGGVDKQSKIRNTPSKDMKSRVKRHPANPSTKHFVKRQFPKMGIPHITQESQRQLEPVAVRSHSAHQTHRPQRCQKWSGMLFSQLRRCFYAQSSVSTRVTCQPAWRREKNWPQPSDFVISIRWIEWQKLGDCQLKH